MIADWSAVPEPVPYAVLTNPQSLNLYTYVQNSPVTHVDLDGHSPASSTESAVGANLSCGMEADAIGGDPQEAACIQSIISYWTDTKQQDDANADAGLAEQNGATPPPADTESKNPASTNSTTDSAPKQNNSQPTTDSNNKSIGDHIFIKVAAGLGVGAEVKAGPVKVGAEVSAKSEGEYTLSGKAQVSAVKEAEASGGAGKYGLGVGYSSEKTTTYNKLNGPPAGPSTQETHFGLLFKTPGSGSASFDSGSLSYEVGVCVVVCISIGIGVK